MVEDVATLNEIRSIGKLLFYDPILSVNNQRSCSSCHRPDMYFSDSTVRTALQLDGVNRLPRNTNSLVNVVFNHLLMSDGLHTEQLQQGKGVIGNPMEMGSKESEVLSKILSCPEYRKAFQKWMPYTPEEKNVTMDHIVSALSIYYSSFSYASAPFDDAMHHRSSIPESAVKGFNLFMGKAQCATCHFVPLFNGVKPPYLSSEFEVVGVPEDTFYLRLSADEGRYKVHPVAEMMHAFRTGTVRNSSHTAPYMHNGVFSSLHQVMDFYNKGGAQGRGLSLPNQTLSSDPLALTSEEIEQLLAFLKTLDESIPKESPPDILPRSGDPSLNTRKIGGAY
jgi:cytochrome c peroxidase